jgi:alpha-ketoglutarate-dependent taurine dioxygenase
MTERANPFGDLADFTPAASKPKADQSVIDQVATEHGFPSRQPKEAQAVPSAPPQEEKNRQKVFRLTPSQDRELRSHCGTLDTTIQDLVIEGINMVLKSKGLPLI